MQSRNLWLICLAFLLLMPAEISSITRGVVKEGLTLQSEILGREVRYSIYLPYDYESSNRRYPAVYLLHGYTDNDIGWIQYGEAHLIADRAIVNREIPPMILIMPDGGDSWYIDNYDGSVPYGTFLTEEFIPEVESRYRIRSEKRFRGIAGLSMGGYGALIHTLKHPELFAACAALSPAVYTEDEVVSFTKERWKRTESVVYGPGLAGEKRLTEHLRNHNPLHLVREEQHPDLSGTRLYIDCGDDDFLYKGNSTLHILFRDKGVHHEYRVRDGEHRWSYWRSGLLEGLRFIGKSFHLP